MNFTSYCSLYICFVLCLNLHGYYNSNYKTTKNNVESSNSYCVALVYKLKTSKLLNNSLTIIKKMNKIFGLGNWFILAFGEMDGDCLKY